MTSRSWSRRRLPAPWRALRSSSCRRTSSSTGPNGLRNASSSPAASSASPWLPSARRRRTRHERPGSPTGRNRAARRQPPRFQCVQQPCGRRHHRPCRPRAGARHDTGRDRLSPDGGDRDHQRRVHAHRGIGRSEQGLRPVLPRWSRSWCCLAATRPKRRSRFFVAISWHPVTTRRAGSLAPTATVLGMDPRFAASVDRAEITDVVHRYCRGDRST